MKKIGRHDNVVAMFGCSTVSSPLCIVLEFAEHGDLLHYLRAHRMKVLIEVNLSRQKGWFRRRKQDGSQTSS